MENLDFLKVAVHGDATLSARYTDGSVAHINGLDLEKLQETSPLLGFAFEETRSGPKYCLENITQSALASLLRFIYSDPHDYVPEQCKDDPISMLTTIHVYHLADIYDIEGLRNLCKGNMIKECEFSCSNPDPPLDLCDAIRYIYEELPKHGDLIDTLANYCVSMFLYHKLGDDVAFRCLAYEHRRFQQDLCMVNIKRGFVDDAALAIIQLPIKPFEREERPFEKAILRDVLYEMWSVLDEIDSKPEQSTATTNYLKEDSFGRRPVPFSFSAPYRHRDGSPAVERFVPLGDGSSRCQQSSIERDNWPLVPVADPAPRGIDYIATTTARNTNISDETNDSPYPPPRRSLPPIPTNAQNDVNISHVTYQSRINDDIRNYRVYGAPPDLAYRVSNAFLKKRHIGAIDRGNDEDDDDDVDDHSSTAGSSPPRPTSLAALAMRDNDNITNKLNNRHAPRNNPAHPRSSNTHIRKHDRNQHQRQHQQPNHRLRFSPFEGKRGESSTAGPTDPRLTFLGHRLEQIQAQAEADMEYEMEKNPPNIEMSASLAAIMKAAVLKRQELVARAVALNASGVTDGEGSAQGGKSPVVHHGGGPGGGLGGRALRMALQENGGEWCVWDHRDGDGNGNEIGVGDGDGRRVSGTGADMDDGRDEDGLAAPSHVAGDAEGGRLRSGSGSGSDVDGFVDVRAGSEDEWNMV